jgi:hypothetical protein
LTLREHATALWIPEQALLPQGDERFVYRVVDGCDHPGIVDRRLYLHLCPGFFRQCVTLLALVLAIGLVVDDAIVMLWSNSVALIHWPWDAAYLVCDPDRL